MALTKYKEKRRFTETPEPTGGKAADQQLRFVVQKHDASHLHYDFRLEMRGVLKSWAVPKGPSTDPDVKRLAMMVEDHPYDYRTFEGVIPKGNYGAGTVIVWDEGTYEAADSEGTDKKQQEKDLLYQLHKGKVKFILHGKKLKGEFVLVKASARGENSWLLMKMQDKYASGSDITRKDKSVQSNKTIEQVAKTSDKVWVSNRTRKKSKQKQAAERPPEVIAGDESSKETAGEDIRTYLEKGTKTKMPADVKPMMATLVTEPFDDPDWLYEIKWDGYRALAYLDKGKAELRSRNNLSYNEKFSPIAEALQSWKTRAVIDGEIIALNEEGGADFQKLQGFAKYGKKASLVYYVFDILWYEGKDLTALPLNERKAVLQAVLPKENAVVRYSDHITGEGTAFFDIALKKGVEGIMAKEASSGYKPGARTRNWLKIRNDRQLEAIICGFTQGRNSRKYFGAVILGKYEGSELLYIGHSGSGIDDKMLKELHERFQPLITDKCPFKKKPKTNMPVTWMKPELVCEVKFTQWTRDKTLRHPIFLGLREDKTAADEKNEKVVDPPEAAGLPQAPVKENAAAGRSVKETVKKARKKAGDKAENRGRTWLPASGKQAVVTLNKRELKLTNLDKMYWPDEKITKRDMLNYYHAVAPYILPYMKDRPQSLNRHPNGIQGKNFFQKDVTGKVADWIETFPYHSESDDEDKEFLVCTDEATLIYLANLGCIEMNPWNSRVQSPDHPDWCVIDLDPDKKEFSFEEVIETARIVKQVLDSIGVPGYCKTSGSRGLHIYIPLGAKYSYDESKLLAEWIVTVVQNELPDITTLERNTSKRQGKIYLDFLQNRSIQTIAAPYSLRPRPGATVSTPLHWEEVKKGLSVRDFTIYNILDRLKNEGDLFKPVLGKGIDLEKTVARLKA